MSRIKLRFNLWDRVVAFFSPKKAIENAAARARVVEYGGQPQAATGAYHGASGTRRRVRSWNPSAGSADADTLDDLATLRERSRDAMRNEDPAGAALRDAVSNVIGRGLVPQSTPEERILQDIPEAEIERWKSETETLWNFWASSRSADFERRETMRGLGRLGYRSTKENGDALALIRQRPTIGFPLQTCIQLVEADRLSNPRDATDGAPAPKRPENRVFGGVEKNRNGVPVAYWIADQHPGDIYPAAGKRSWARVPSVGSLGQPLCLHLIDPDRIGQSRTAPWIAPVLETIHSIAGYRGSALDAAQLANIFSIAITNPRGDGLGGAGWSADGESGGEPTVGDDEIALGSGSVFELKDGQGVEQIKAEHPVQGFESFVNTVLKLVGARLGIPLEVLTKHFESSYSAARAALLSAWRFYMDEREWCVEKLYTPVRETVILEGVASGLIRPPPGFWESPIKRWAWLRASWGGPSPAMLDPEKEIRAASMAIAEGIKTRAEVTADLTGGDWETKHRQRVREERMRKAGGLDVESAAERIRTEPQTPVDGDDAEAAA